MHNIKEIQIIWGKCNEYSFWCMYEEESTHHAELQILVKSKIYSKDKIQHFLIVLLLIVHIIIKLLAAFD